MGFFERTLLGGITVAPAAIVLSTAIGATLLAANPRIDVPPATAGSVAGATAGTAPTPDPSGGDAAPLQHSAPESAAPASAGKNGPLIVKGIAPGLQVAMDNGYARVTKLPDGRFLVELLDPTLGGTYSEPSSPAKGTGIDELFGKVTKEIR
jgi:hypothetical protein